MKNKKRPSLVALSNFPPHILWTAAPGRGEGLNSALISILASPSWTQDTPSLSEIFVCF